MQHDEIKIKGFFRMRIRNKDGKIVADSGFVENVITNDGFTYCLARCAMAGAGSYPALYGAIGTGGAVSKSHTQLPGSIGSRTALTTSAVGTAQDAATARMLATFEGSDGSGSIDNVGLYSSTGAGGLICGQVYSSSELSTNQQVNMTYELRFAT